MYDDLDNLYYDEKTKQWTYNKPMPNMDSLKKAISEIQAEEDKKILELIDVIADTNDQAALDAALGKLEGKMATTFTNNSYSFTYNSPVTFANTSTVTSTGSISITPGTNSGSWSYTTNDGYVFRQGISSLGPYSTMKKACCGPREIQEYKGKK